MTMENAVSIDCLIIQKLNLVFLFIFKLENSLCNNTNTMNNYNNPCANKGVCIQAYDSYFCQCAINYNGKNCSQCSASFTNYPFCNVTVDICATKPCLNGGVCKNNATSETGYFCDCSTGFSGSSCSIVANPCL